MIQTGALPPHTHLASASVQLSATATGGEDSFLKSVLSSMHKLDQSNAIAEHSTVSKPEVLHVHIDRHVCMYLCLCSATTVECFNAAAHDRNCMIELSETN
jgi:hypothetical protein